LVVVAEVMVLTKGSDPRRSKNPLSIIRPINYADLAQIRLSILTAFYQHCKSWWRNMVRHAINTQHDINVVDLIARNPGPDVSETNVKLIQKTGTYLSRMTCGMLSSISTKVSYGTWMSGVPLSETTFVAGKTWVPTVIESARNSQDGDSKSATVLGMFSWQLAESYPP
jgi:hypothetical protein